MKIAIFCFAFFLVIANAKEWRNEDVMQSIVEELMNKYEDQIDLEDYEDSDNWQEDLTETDIDSINNSSEILTETPPGYILNNNHVEDINEEENEDFFQNGIESEEEDVDLGDAVGLSETEINAMNNYEGDEMIISEENNKRGVGSSTRLWPRINGKLNIPYYIDKRISRFNRGRIAYYIKRMNKHLKGCNSDSSDVWVKRNLQRHYIRFRNSRGCSSYLGYQRRSNQPIYLAPACTRSATVLHEMLHAMGFSHEQSRSDRDKYVKINYGNIQPGRQRNFNRLSSMRRESLRTPYDYGSVMHYGKTAFSKNKRATIVPLKSNVQIGQRIRMSRTDIKELNSVYKCAAAPTTTTTTLLACNYNRGRCPYFYHRRVFTSGYLTTKAANSLSWAVIYKSRYPKIPALNKCRCTSTGYCYRRNFCVQFKYAYTNPIRNIWYNSLSVYGYAYQRYGKRKIRKFKSPYRYAPGGGGWKTMRTTISLNCGQYMSFRIRTAPKQNTVVKIDNFIVKYGKC